MEDEDGISSIKMQGFNESFVTLPFWYFIVQMIFRQNICKFSQIGLRGEGFNVQSCSGGQESQV